MQAVIMAGGKGTRLASVTKDIPKPMVKIDGKPLLQYQIENLRDNGVLNIILIIGHLGYVIREYFGDGSKFGMKISYFEENSPLGTAGALSEIKSELEDDFFLIFGDLFLNVNFKRFRDFHLSKDALITLFVHPNSHPYDSDIVIVNEKQCVVEWSYKNSERKKDYDNLVNAGLYVVNKALVESLPAHEKLDLEKDIITQKLETGKVYAYHSTEYVKDVGTPERLNKVTDDFLNGICEKRNLSHKQKAIFLDRDGTINRYVGFLNKVEQMELEPNAAKAIEMINQSEYLAIIITNQPVVARGECTFEELDKINRRMYSLLGNEGAYVDGLYFCPHHPDSGFKGEIKELKMQCDCRKPKIGMIENAEKDFNIDLENSWFIGDTCIDVQTGKNAKMNTIMLETGDPNKQGKYETEPDVICKDLLLAAQHIINHN